MASHNYRSAIGHITEALKHVDKDADPAMVGLLEAVKSIANGLSRDIEDIEKHVKRIESDVRSMR